jgi:glyoxylase-like metal-dependent hydrolase (beta-lactamase superfamily II)
MWRPGLLALALLAIFARDTSPQVHPQVQRTAESVVTDVAKTIGAAVVKSIQYSGSGFDGYNYSCKPGGPWAQFKLTSYSRVLDYEKVASQEVAKWTQYNKACGAGFQPIMGSITDMVSMSGDFGWVYGGPGPDNPPAEGSPSPGSVEGQKFEMALTPYGWAKAAMAANANPTIETKTVDGRQLAAVSFMWNGKRKITGYVNAHNLLVRTESWSNNDILGDVDLITNYSEYKDFSGIQVPMRIVRMECAGKDFPVKFSAGEGLPGCQPRLDLTVTNVLLNAPTHIDVPDSIRQAARTGGEARGVQSQKLTDGVWVLNGGGTQSMAIEFKDYSVVVEASGNEARSLAIIAETKKLILNKPIKYVVNTHHHLDHSGGLRTFVAEGSTIVTQEINKPFYEQIFQYPHAIKPDKLALNPKPAVFLTVKDSYVLSDGTRSLRFDRQLGQEHDEGLLMVYLPNEKILFPSDGFMLNHFHPGVRTTVGMGQNVLDNIGRLKLDVQQVVPVHTTPGIFAVSFADARKRILERSGDGN